MSGQRIVHLATVEVHRAAVDSLSWLPVQPSPTVPPSRRQNVYVGRSRPLSEHPTRAAGDETISALPMRFAGLAAVRTVPTHRLKSDGGSSATFRPRSDACGL